VRLAVLLIALGAITVVATRKRSRHTI
jgi:hypothetical protein